MLTGGFELGPGPNWKGPSSLWAFSSKTSQSSSQTRRSRHRPLKVSPPTPSMPPLKEAPFPARIPLIPVIERAKTLLEKETVRYFPAAAGQPARREIKLALADFRTGEIRIVSGTESRGQLSLKDPSVRFELDWWNGFNSSISILEPSHSAVVALLYALSQERQRLFGQDAIIYTPFSSALLQTELVEAGRRYLMGKIRQARESLAQVPSRAIPGTTLADSPAFTDEDYFDLILSEHMDPGRFRAIVGSSIQLSPEQERQLMLLAARILIILGTNQEDAYRFTGSPAGAQGLAQFTRIGMQVVWNYYPAAGLPRDFRQAATQHLHALKAQICLMDHDLSELLRTYPGLQGSADAKYAVAAAYNGGLRRVRHGLQQFGTQWLRPRLRLKELEQKALLTSRERQEFRWLTVNRSHETFVYLNKLHALDKSPLKSAWEETENLPLVLQMLLFPGFAE